MKRVPYLPYLFALILLGASACNNGENKQPLPSTTNQAVEQDDKTNTAADRKGNAATPPDGFFENYENTNRVIWQKPEIIIEMMGDMSDKMVADIGAGTGHFALRLAKEAQQVLAIDIDPRYTSYIDSIKAYELPEAYQEVLQTRIAKPEDPNLQPEELDIAIIVNTYMYVTDRVQWAAKVREGLKKSGKFIVIDFKKKRTPIGPPAAYRVPLYMVEEELEKAGFKNIETNDATLDYQYIVVAER